MRTEFWNGKGHTPAKPFTEVTEHDATVLDGFGRAVLIPKGSTCRHFETTNKGWLMWKAPGEKSHITDVG